MTSIVEVSKTRAEINIHYDSRNSKGQAPLAELATDLIVLSTKRAVNEAAGMWSMTLWDRRDQFQGRWWQHLRPMDYIEIRIERHPKDTTNKLGSRGAEAEKMPLIMRGFVDQVTYALGIGPDQKPQRTVTIQGRDYGKLLMIKQIYIPRFLDPLNAAYSAGGGTGPNSPFFSQFVKDLAKPNISPQEYLDKMQKYFIEGVNPAPEGSGSLANGGGALNLGGGALNLRPSAPKLKLTADASIREFIVNYISLQTLQGPVWNLLRHYQGDPVTEFLMQEGEDNPILLWRWTPYKEKYGGPILTGSNAASAPETYRIQKDDVLQYTMTTTDRDLFNYYFTYGTAIGIDGESAQMAAAADSGVTSGGQTTYGSKNPIFRKDSVERYGFRPFYLEFPLMIDQRTKTTTENNDIQKQLSALAAKISDWMDKAFSNSASLEMGRMVVKGNPHLKAGMYLNMPEIEQEWYIQGVEHTVSTSPVGYTTTLDLIRGMSKNTPYPDDSAGTRGVSVTNPNPPAEVPVDQLVHEPPEEKIEPGSTPTDVPTINERFPTL